MGKRYTLRKAVDCIITGKENLSDQENTKYAVGEKVLARWTDGIRYPARISSHYAEMYEVIFDDGMSRKCKYIHLSKLQDENNSITDKSNAREKQQLEQNNAGIRCAQDGPVSDIVVAKVHHDEKFDSPVSDTVVATMHRCENFDGVVSDTVVATEHNGENCDDGSTVIPLCSSNASIDAIQLPASLTISAPLTTIKNNIKNNKIISNKRKCENVPDHSDDIDYIGGYNSDDSLRDPDYVENFDEDEESEAESDVESLTQNYNDNEEDSEAAMIPIAINQNTVRELKSAVLRAGDELTVAKIANMDVITSNIEDDLEDGNGTEEREQNPGVKKRSKQYRTVRPCLFCGTLQSNLKRHIIKIHKGEPEVQAALLLPAALSNESFNAMRKTGMLKFNQKIMSNKDDSPKMYQRERKMPSLVEVDNIVYCSRCKGFYANKYFPRHKKTCVLDSAVQKPLPKKIKLSLLEVEFAELSEAFKADILSKFKSNEIGEICRNDPCIVHFGAQLFERVKRKKDNAQEVRKSVMQDMRRLAHLYLEFKTRCIERLPIENHPRNAADILDRDNFEILRESIVAYTSKEDGESIKAGLKNAVQFLIKKFCEIQIASYLAKKKDSLAIEAEKFEKVFDSYQDSIFGDSSYELLRNRQIKLRRPEELPLEEDVEKLKIYTVSRMAEIISDPFVLWDPSLFAELRDLLVCRLTLFNARRGGEPARLLISEWKDAETGAWFDPQRLANMDEVERRMFQDMKLTYQAGKGRHLVPIIIPTDTIKAMTMLCDPQVKSMADVNVHNRFMFPCTQGSESHVNGWHATNRICKAAGVERLSTLNATKMRHRISTWYAALDVPDNERETFYRHMGHSAHINANIYQTPLAEAEVRRVGTHLTRMDGRYNVPSAALGRAPHSPNSNTVVATVQNDENFDTGSAVISVCSSNASIEVIPSAVSLTIGSPLTTITSKPVKQYSRFGSEDNQKITSYFHKWLTGDGFPVKADVMAFKALHPEITQDWKRIRNKITNDKKHAKDRADRNLKKRIRE